MSCRAKNQQGLGAWRWGLAFTAIAMFLFGTGSKLKYTEDRTPTMLNPLYADDMYTERSTELLFERLIGWDQDQKPAPMLAVSWKIALNKKSILLQLRKGVKWHDGKPFTSKDVVFTFKAMTSTRTQLTDRYLAAIIDKVTPKGKHAVNIAFKKPLGKPLKWLQLKIIPAHAFPKGQVNRNHVFNQKPIGTGPFKFKRWIGRKIQFIRFKQHWRGSKIKLKQVVLQAIADKNIQVAVLRYGGLDSIIRVRPKDIPLFEKDRNIQLHPYSTNDWWYLGLNQKRGSILRDQRVREALLYALDRENLRDAHLGDGQVISGPFSPNDPLYNFSINARVQNKAKANKLLDASGWKRSSEKAIRKKKGKSLKLRLLIPRSKNSYKALCEAMQGEFRRVGIEVELIWLDDASWNRSVFTKKNFDMVMHIWNFDDLSSIQPLFHSKGSRNYVGYKNAEVDRSFKQASKTTDPVIYKTIYGKLHKVLHKDLPYLFLWSLTNYSSVSNKVKNVTIHNFNYFHYLHSWQKKP